MKVRKSKTKKVKDSNIRSVVRQEMEKSLLKEKQMMNSESMREYNKYYKTTGKKFMLDLLKPSLNLMIKESFVKGITTQVIKSLMNKF